MRQNHCANFHKVHQLEPLRTLVAVSRKYLSVSYRWLICIVEAAMLDPLLDVGSSKFAGVDADL